MGGKAKGCMTGCLVVLVLASLLVAGAYIFLKQYMIDNFLARMERQGYRIVREEAVDVGERIREPTVYYGKSVTLSGGSERGVAILAQTAEINGHFKGNVRFFGETITLQPGASLDYDLHAFAGTIHLHGRVKGKITGIHLEMSK